MNRKPKTSNLRILKFDKISIQLSFETKQAWGMDIFQFGSLESQKWRFPTLTMIESRPGNSNPIFEQISNFQNI